MYIHMNIVYIRYIICILRVETTIVVVAPGSGGMANAKARDTIFYVIYTVIKYISLD